MHIQGEALLTSPKELIEIIKQDRIDTLENFILKIGHDKPMTAKQAHEFLQIDAATFHKYLHRANNPIPYTGKARMRRFEKADLREWLKTMKDE